MTDSERNVHNKTNNVSTWSKLSSSIVSLLNPTLTRGEAAGGEFSVSNYSCSHAYSIKLLVANIGESKKKKNASLFDHSAHYELFGVTFVPLNALTCIFSSSTNLYETSSEAFIDNVRNNRRVECGVVVLVATNGRECRIVTR